MSMIRVCLLASVAVVLPAQDSTRLTGPTSGLLFDAPSRALRVVMGVPGSAYLGAAVASDLDAASVAPNRRWALAISNGAVSIIEVAGSAAPVVLDGTCEGTSAAVMAWSADSSAAGLACSDGVRLYRVTSGSAERQPLADFSGAKALAVDAAGQSVFAAGLDGIYRVDADGAHLLAGLEDVSSLALAGGTLYAVDRAAGQVVALDDLSGSGAMRVAAGPGQGVEDPLAVGVSADGTRLFVAEGESHSLKAFNPATAELMGTVALDFTAARVDSFGNGLFLLNSRQQTGDVIQVLDPRQLAVYFIPAQELHADANTSSAPLN